MRELSQTIDLVLETIRGRLHSIGKSIRFRRSGRNFRLYGSKHMNGIDLAVGDNCWFQAVDSYKGSIYQPRITIGAASMFGNNVHISAIKSITIGKDCLLGSNIYIGDHSHGSTRQGCIDLDIPPAQRALGDACDIVIGERVWVGDGAVILAGSTIADGCIIGANSVVKGKFENAAVIAGAPARVIKELL
ncbi:acyltransferase|nr:acyltransferase [Stenotrophomonas sp. SbOxS2]